MLHLLVEDVDAWWARLNEVGIAEKYGVTVSEVQMQPWRMQDFTLHDPSGVLWRIGQNTDSGVGKGKTGRAPLNAHPSRR